MAAKQKKFRVQRRFDYWGEIEITADSFDDAVAKAKEIDDIDDFYVKSTTLDWNWLPGFGVTEAW